MACRLYSGFSPRKEGLAMQDFTAALGKVTIGLDLGDKYSHYHTVDAMGNSTERDRLATTPEVFRLECTGLKPGPLDVNACSHSTSFKGLRARTCCYAACLTTWHI